MARVIKKGDAMILSDAKPYAIINTVEYDGRSYALIRQIPEDVLFRGSLTTPDLLVEEVVLQDKVDLLPVNDKKLQQTLLKLLK